jgi:hypothetical protein
MTSVCVCVCRVKEEREGAAWRCDTKRLQSEWWGRPYLAALHVFLIIGTISQCFFHSYNEHTTHTFKLDRFRVVGVGVRMMGSNRVGLNPVRLYVFIMYYSSWLPALALSFRSRCYSCCCYYCCCCYPPCRHHHHHHLRCSFDGPRPSPGWYRGRTDRWRPPTNPPL